MKNLKAFNLSEAVLGIIIMAIIIGLVNLWIPTFMYNQKNTTPRNINWQRLLANLEEKSNPITWTKISESGKQLYIKKYATREQITREYVLKKTQKTNRFYISGINGGYMPMIYDVKNVKFSEVNNCVLMEVIFLDGDEIGRAHV